MDWAIFGALFIFVLIGFAILGDHLRQKRKMASQEMMQRERLAAMEKGIPIPDWVPDVQDESDSITSNPEAYQRKRQSFRFMTLCVSLVLVFTGLGMSLAFELSRDPGFNEMASLGVIPLMTGLGLLLFHWLTRDSQTS